MERKISYTEACTMTLDEIMYINAALDSQIERVNNARGGN